MRSVLPKEPCKPTSQRFPPGSAGPLEARSGRIVRDTAEGVVLSPPILRQGADERAKREISAQMSSKYTDVLTGPSSKEAKMKQKWRLSGIKSHERS